MASRITGRSSMVVGKDDRCTKDAGGNPFPRITPPEAKKYEQLDLFNTRENPLTGWPEILGKDENEPYNLSELEGLE